MTARLCVSIKSLTDITKSSHGGDLLVTDVAQAEQLICTINYCIAQMLGSDGWQEQKKKLSSFVCLSPVLKETVRLRFRAHLNALGIRFLTLPPSSFQYFAMSCQISSSMKLRSNSRAHTQPAKTLASRCSMMPNNFYFLPDLCSVTSLVMSRSKQSLSVQLCHSRLGIPGLSAFARIFVCGSLPSCRLLYS